MAGLRKAQFGFRNFWSPTLEWSAPQMKASPLASRMFASVSQYLLEHASGVWGYSRAGVHVFVLIEHNAERVLGLTRIRVDLGTGGVRGPMLGRSKIQERGQDPPGYGDHGVD